MSNALTGKALCKMVKDKYDGDARKLRSEGEDSQQLLKSKLKEFKGIGM